MIRDCTNCGKFFTTKPYMVRANKGIFCSVGCRAEAKRNERGPVPQMLLQNCKFDFNLFYKNHYQKALRIAILNIRDIQHAEEIVDEAFLYMCYSWNSFQIEDYAYGFLITKVKRLCWNANKKKSDAALSIDGLEEMLPAYEEGSEYHEILLHLIDLFIQELPPIQRTIVLLRYKGHKFLDIAAKIRICTSSVTTLFYKAERELKSRILKSTEYKEIIFH